MSQRSDWRRFVDRRRRELRDAYPCAMPTHRLWCPLHHTSVGPVSALCAECHRELFRQLAIEYVNNREKETTMHHRSHNRSTLPAKYIPGQLGLFDTDDSSREHEDEPERIEDETNAGEAFDDAA